MADITRTCGLYYPSDSSYQRISGVLLYDEEGYLSLSWDEEYPFPYPGDPDPPEASSVEILVVKQSDYSRVAFETVDYDYPSETGFYDIALSEVGEYYVFMRLYFSNKETFGPWSLFGFTYAEGDTGADMRLNEDNNSRYLFIDTLDTEIENGNTLIGMTSLAVATVIADPILISGSYAEGDASIVCEVLIEGPLQDDEDICIQDALSTNLISNPDFASDTWWEKYPTDGTVTISGGTGNIATTTEGYLYKSHILDLAKKYYAKADVIANNGSAHLGIYNNSGTWTAYDSFTGGATGALEAVFSAAVANAGNPAFALYNESGSVVSFDNAELYELVANGSLFKIEDANVRLLEDGRKRALES